MTKVLFLDRDGTLIVEPQDDYQVDTLEKLEFLPGVFQYLSRIAKELDYELVIVSNQDGLGKPMYPIESFQKVQGKMIQAFTNEGIIFSDVLIDSSLPEDNAPTRKPRTGLLTKYLTEKYDLKNSFVIGDRLTDIELAKNLGTQGILLNPEMTLSVFQGEISKSCALKANSWSDIYNFLKHPPRKARICRATKETDISVEINLDGYGKSEICTGLGFFNHLLEQIPRHSGFDLHLTTKGDLHVDEHHTIEDTAIVLGEAFHKALGDKKGIERYSFCLPMDDSLAQVAIDFGGRNWLVWKVEFKREKIGDVPTEMFSHFFKSFTDAARCNLNISCEGENEHHIIESIFKAFAKTLKMAVKRDEKMLLPTTKGVL